MHILWVVLLVRIFVFFYEKYDSYIWTKLCKPNKSGTSSNYYTISTISLMVFVGCTEFRVIKTWPPNTNRTLKLHKYVGTFILSERTQKWLWFSRENPLITVLELVEETTRDSHEHILFWRVDLSCSSVYSESPFQTFYNIVFTVKKILSYWDFVLFT